MKVELFVHWSIYQGRLCGDPKIFLADMTEYGYILSDAIEVEIDDPVAPEHRQVIAAQVNILRQELGKHQHEIDKIEEQISQLTAIEYKRDA